MDEEKKPRHRSPNYPTVGLREAVERVGKLYGRDGKAGAPPEIAAVHIGFGKPHGQAMSVLAALKKFGLIAESNGRVVPTQRTIEIVNLPEGDSRREKAIKEAVLEPPIYKELIEQHKETGWPDDDVLASELVTYKNFNPNAVNGFVTDLKDSLEYAGLSSGVALRLEIEETEVLAIEEQAQATTNEHLAKKAAKQTFEARNEISLPVGVDDDGQAIFAHVRFDGGPKKELMAALRMMLEVMEKRLA